MTTTEMLNENLASREEQEKIVLQPCHYTQFDQGEKVVFHIAMAYNFWLNIDSSKLRIVYAIMNSFYNVSIVMDDIEDNTKLRRGKPAAYRIYGISRTVNSGTYAFLSTFDKILDLNHPGITKLFIELVMDYNRAQGMDIYWRDNFKCPSVDEYKKIATQKTAFLTLFTIKLMQIFSDNQDDFTKLVNSLSLYFQIRDDYVNLTSKEYAETKGYCEDLTEGKFSFPVVYAINANLDDDEILNILKLRTNDNAIKKHCVELLEKCGALDYTRKVLEELRIEAEEEIDKLGGNPKLLSMLKEFRSLL